MNPTRLAHQLRLITIFLFSLGLFQVVVVSMVPVRADGLDPEHWRSTQRELIVVDRTGDPRWQQATRHGVDAWNQAAGPNTPRLTWASGGGACEPDGVRISVCASPMAGLGKAPPVNRQGLADVDVATDGHTKSATVVVCSDCDVDDARRRVIATHEIGHTLGLTHTRRATSVMLHTGGAEHPDALDASRLRSIYDHTDGPAPCGRLNLRLAGRCL